MPITAQSAARPKLNLPPLRAIEGGKTVDAAELDRFTRAIAEWGVKVDQWNSDQDGSLDVINANIAALATRVDILESLTTPTEWTNVTYVNSWADAAPSLAVQYRKIGDIVYLRGSAMHPTDGRGLSICVLPYTPPYDNQAGTIGYTGTWGLAEFDVLTTGAVRYNSTNPIAPQYLPMTYQFSTVA